jgi:glutamate synthase (NADPH/NADH) small chain
VTQLEILPKPPEKENKELTWPYWPNKLRTSSSHEEGCRREWSVATKAMTGDQGQVKELQLIRVDWHRQANGQWQLKEIAGSEFTLKADLVLLAMGFVHPIHEGLLKELAISLDKSGNVNANTDNYQTSVDKVFAAGDMRRGQSLVVWAIREGRQAANAVDTYLMGHSELPR